MKSRRQEMLSWYEDVPRTTRVPALCGYALLAVSLFGFGVWASTAPIAGAIVASGAFVATGQNKTVQHLEGGVIRDIMVREGDLVEKGQVLIQLDETTPKADLRRLSLRHDRLIAIEARLQAEIDDQKQVRFPQALLDKGSDPDIATILESQRLTFDARRKNLASEIATIQEGIDGLEQRVGGTKQQLVGVNRQLNFIGEELEAKSQLLKSGLVRKPEVLALQRASANLEGEIGRLNGELGDARERIARGREQIQGARNLAAKTAVEQLHETRAELNDLRERMQAQRRVLERIEITAPVKGVVVKLRYHTAGGVIEPGKNILEIVPLQAELIIEVRIRPRDIESARKGQKASVRLVALNSRLTPMVSGEVIYVSADALPPDQAGQQNSGDNYVGRIRLDAKEVAELGAGFEPTPGMPAEVYIKTSERTFLDYMLQPLKDTMARSFRET
jgi:HlyD family type I secretion membrane fusion protein